MGDTLLAHIPDDMWAAESILRLAWQIVTMRAGGVLMHGCAVAWSGRGVAAIGVSGAGKSTLASLCSGHPGHALLLTDEIVQLFPDGMVWGTPFRSNVENVGAPGPAKLETLLLLEKGDHEALTPVPAAEALPQLIPQLFAPMAGITSRGEAVRRVMEIADKVGVHRLTFRKDAAVGPFLRDWLAARHPEDAGTSPHPPLRGTFSRGEKDVGEILSGQAQGKVMWISVRGRSMWPLLRGGESLRVRRCAASELEPGDIAVLLRSDGQLVAHSVVETAPLRTAGFLGRVDEPGLTPLAKAEVVRRGRVEVPLGRLRPVLRGAQVVAAAAAQIERGAVGLAEFPRASRARRLPGQSERGCLAPTVRRITPAEPSAFSVALSRWETLPGPLLESLVHRHAALGVWARGRLAGTGARGEDGALRHLHLASWLRNCGVGEHLVRELWQPSVSRVEVGEEEQELVQVFAQRGLVPAGRTSSGLLVLRPR